MTHTHEISLLCDGCPTTVHITTINVAEQGAERVEVHCPACGATVLDMNDTVLSVTTS